MSATAPFSGEPTRSDWLLLNQLADRQNQSDWPGVQTYLQAFGSFEFAGIPPASPLPLIILWDAGGVSYVSVTGTTSFTGWIVNIAAFPFVSSPSGHGSVSPGVNALAVTTWGLVKPQVDTWGHPIVFMGHSQGAAVASLLASLATHDGFTVQGVYLAGSPGYADTVFASWNDSITYRLEDTLDPIVSLPPVTPTPIPLLPWPWSQIREAVTAARVGSAETLDQYGALVEGSTPMPYLAALSQLVLTQSAPTHLPSEYVRRLLAGGNALSDVQPGANGYVAPWYLYDLAPPPGGLSLSQEGTILAAERAVALAAALCRVTCSAIPGTSPGP